MLRIENLEVSSPIRVKKFFLILSSTASPEIYDKNTLGCVLIQGWGVKCM